tara:strand:+ start:84 stop:1157 length:1074 start_codon:yes stop_codon:yes gene_type:complete
MSQANKTKVELLIDDDSNGIMLAWPDVYETKSYWKNILETYYQLINDCLINDKHIILITRKNRDIKKDLRNINKNLNVLIDKKSYFHIYKLNYDDIWLRDQGPLMLKESICDYNFSLFRFNGYGNKYNYANDKTLSKKIIEKYNFDHKKNHKIPLNIFKDLVIEPGNIVYDDRLCIVNKNPLMMHNNLEWTDINNILKEGFEKILKSKYIVMDLGSLSGDDTNGHIDNLIRLEGSNNLYYMATNDKLHPDYKILNDLENKIMNTNFNDRTISPIYHDSIDIVKSSNNEILPFSYLNYIKIGNFIFMPSNKNTNENKKDEIRNIFNNDNIYFIDITGLLNQKGGLHCCSMNFREDKIL